MSFAFVNRVSNVPFSATYCSSFETQTYFAGLEEHLRPLLSYCLVFRDIHHQYVHTGLRGTTTGVRRGTVKNAYVFSYNPCSSGGNALGPVTDDVYQMDFLFVDRRGGDSSTSSTDKEDNEVHLHTQMSPIGVLSGLQQDEESKVKFIQYVQQHLAKLPRRVRPNDLIRISIRENRKTSIKGTVMGNCVMTIKVKYTLPRGSLLKRETKSKRGLAQFHVNNNNDNLDFETTTTTTSDDESQDMDGLLGFTQTNARAKQQNQSQRLKRRRTSFFLDPDEMDENGDESDESDDEYDDEQEDSAYENGMSVLKPGVINRNEKSFRSSGKMKSSSMGANNSSNSKPIVTRYPDVDMD